MKILLFGDYSSIHLNLKLGLIEQGFDVTLTSFGDGWKRIPSDIELGPKYLPGRLRKYFAAFDLIVKKKVDFQSYDIIQLINPTFIPNNIGLSQKINESIFQSDSKYFLSACGNDYYYYMAVNQLKYNPFKGDDRATRYFISSKLKEQNDFAIDQVLKVIPSAYTYWKAYEKFDKRVDIIPFPFCKSKDIPINFKLNRKIKIYHSISREKFISFSTFG